MPILLRQSNCAPLRFAPSHHIFLDVCWQILAALCGCMHSNHGSGACEGSFSMSTLHGSTALGFQVCCEWDLCTSVLARYLPGAARKESDMDTLLLHLGSDFGAACFASIATNFLLFGLEPETRVPALAANQLSFLGFPAFQGCGMLQGGNLQKKY